MLNLKKDTPTVIDYDTLFVFVDDFSQGFEPWYQQQLLSNGRRKRKRCGQMSLSEVLTILIAYHQSGRTCLKYFYLDLYATGRHLFPTLVSYPRFVTLIKQAFPALLCLLKSPGERSQNICSSTQLPWPCAITCAFTNIRFLKTMPLVVIPQQVGFME